VSGPITAYFGAKDIPEHANGHTGLDIGIPSGTAVRAPAFGVVESAQANHPVFGSYVILRHAGGLRTLYAHLSRIDVVQGQGLQPGDGLGLSGNTGLSTGPHLHWACAVDGDPLRSGPHLRDPLACISAAPRAGERERLLRAAAFGIHAALQAAGQASAPTSNATSRPSPRVRQNESSSPCNAPPTRSSRAGSTADSNRPRLYP